MIYIRKKILPFNDTKFNDNNNIFKKQIVQNINYNNDNINSLIKSKSENKFKINNINNILILNFLMFSKKYILFILLSIFKIISNTV
jgi:hypothetical protein